MAYRRIFAAALAVSLLTLTACGGGNSSGDTSGDAPVAGVAVQVQEVTSSTISNENRVSGRVMAETQTTVMVGTSATCTAVYVEVGDTVQAGDRICTLDLASTIASYNAATISYNSAAQSYQDQAAILDAQIALYEKNLADTKALFEIGAAAQIEIDQAELTLMNARAQKTSALSQLEAGMQSYQANIDQLSSILENVDGAGHVIAPASGTIISLSAVEKGMVAPTAPVAVIDGVDQLQVTVAVSEALIPKISVGDEVDVVVSAIEASFVGTIRTIDRSANLQTGLYTVNITVPANLSGLLSGMFADVTFRTDTSYNTIVVPSEAILTTSGVQYVFVVENDTAKYIEVTTGLSGNGVTEVTSGLTAGQQLVTVGQAYLSDGDPVRIV